MHRKATAVLLALTMIPSGGCSFMFMSRAPDPVPAPNYPVECTSSTAAPVLDSVCTGYFAVNTAVIAGMKDCKDAYAGESCLDGKGGGMALSLGLGALCLASAVSGFGKAQECQAVKNQNALCITGNVQACGALNPNWRPTVTPAPQPVPPAAPAATPAPVPALAPALPAAPAQRFDGLPAGANCTATWQCAVGLACPAGVCAAP
ncbi:MAG: hypothetical protein QM704_04130 [Anaeromyxobacteraceae bacterium]